MPTLLECLLELDELKRRKNRSVGWGSDADYDREQLSAFEARLGEAMIASADDLVALVGDVQIRMREKLPDFEERALAGHDPSHPSYAALMLTMPRALDAAVAEGASTIAVYDELAVSVRSRIGWAASRNGGTVLFVAPNEAIAEQTRREISRTEGVVAPTRVVSLRTAVNMFVDGGPSGIGTVYFLERHPEHDPIAGRVVEDIRRAHPDVLVVYDVGYPDKRRIAEPDVVLKRPGVDHVRTEWADRPAPRI